MSNTIRLDPRRAKAVRDTVTNRCEALKLCPDAASRVMGRAMRNLREGASAAKAAAEGAKLARRLATYRENVLTQPRPAQ